MTDPNVINLNTHRFTKSKGYKPVVTSADLRPVTEAISQEAIQCLIHGNGESIDCGLPSDVEQPETD